MSGGADADNSFKPPIRGGGVPIGDAASRWGIAGETVEEWVWAGRLPHHLAHWSSELSQWRLDGRKVVADAARRAAASGGLWLARVEVDGVAAATAAWADNAHPDARQSRRLDVVWWCASAAVPPLRAGPLEFADWCGDHTHGAAVTARRYDSVAAWYEMLTQFGVPHGDPVTGTRVAVLWEEPQDWDPTESGTVGA